MSLIPRHLRARADVLIAVLLPIAIVVAWKECVPLFNVRRHSGSTVARIHLERQPQALDLEIEDEGHGMRESIRDDETLIAASGIGIAGIRESVREHGGQMHIRSRDSGTIISVTRSAFEIR